MGVSLSGSNGQPTDISPPTKKAAIMWASPARLLSQVTVTLFLLLVLISDQPVSSSPQPGHLVHDFYKCSSKFYYDFSRCKLEREEAARRGLNRRSRQIHHNSASKQAGQASLVFVALATILTQTCQRQGLLNVKEGVYKVLRMW